MTQNPIRTLNDTWELLITHIFPKNNASKEQLDEMKKAFFSGAWTMFNIHIIISKLNVSDEMSAKYIKELHNEMVQFQKDLNKNHAERN